MIACTPGMIACTVLGLADSTAGALVAVAGSAGAGAGAAWIAGEAAALTGAGARRRKNATAPITTIASATAPTYSFERPRPPRSRVPFHDTPGGPPRRSATL